MQVCDVEHIHINEIFTSKNDVRRKVNPAEEQIRYSLERRGLKGVLEVNKIHNGYGIVSGGNTRSTILKQLYSDTSDSFYSHVNCVVVDSTYKQTVISHLIENDARGDLTFIDRVVAIAEVIESRRTVQKTIGQVGVVTPRKRRILHRQYISILDYLCT